MTPTDAEGDGSGRSIDPRGSFLWKFLKKSQNKPTNASKDYSTPLESFLIVVENVSFLMDVDEFFYSGGSDWDEEAKPAPRDGQMGQDGRVGDGMGGPTTFPKLIKTQTTFDQASCSLS